MRTLHRQTYCPTEEEHKKIEEAILNYPVDCRIKNYLNFRKRDWVIFKIGSLTGMRISEILNINTSWIDQQLRIITIPAEHNKTKTESKIWINDTLLAILQEYLKDFEKYIINGNLFMGLRGRALNNNKHPGRPLTVENWGARFRKYLISGGLMEVKFIDKKGFKQSKIRSHTATRTYFINQLFKNNPNRNIFELSRVTRHKSINCLYNHYLRFKDQELWQECVNKINWQSSKPQSLNINKPL